MCVLVFEWKLMRWILINLVWVCVHSRLSDHLQPLPSLSFLVVLLQVGVTLLRPAMNHAVGIYIWHCCWCSLLFVRLGDLVQHCLDDVIPAPLVLEHGLSLGAVPLLVAVNPVPSLSLLLNILLDLTNFPIQSSLQGENKYELLLEITMI